MMKAIYQGFFMDKPQMDKVLSFCQNKDDLLSSIVKDLHITFEFSPIELFKTELMEKSFSVKVIGYGFDGLNQGLLVEIPEELKSFYKGAEKPHITVSFDKENGGKPIDTKHLDFSFIEPFFITGYMGIFTNKQIVVRRDSLEL